MSKQRYTGILNKIPEKDIDTVAAAHRINIVDRQVTFKVTVLEPIKTLEDFHDYMKAYNEYIGWKPWRVREMFFDEKDPDDGHIRSRRMATKNIAEALKARTLYTDTGNPIKEAILDCKDKYG